VRLIVAIFFVILGFSVMAWALFLALGYPGLMLLGGAMVAAVGLLAIPVDGRDR
jgi:hypothetical protein